MKLNGYAADPINRGIQQLFQSIAIAPMMRQQAQQQTGLMDAQTYQAEMSGNKTGTEADALRMTLGNRQNIEQIIREHGDMPEWMKNGLRVYAITGAGDPSQMSGHFQQQSLIDEAHAAIPNTVTGLDRSNWLTSMSRGNTYEPYTHIGDTGYMGNKATGNIVSGNPTMTDSFAQTRQSQDTLHQAQAYQAREAGNKYKAEATPGGQGAKQYWEGTGKNLADYEKKLNERIEGGNRLMLKLDSQSELLKEFKPGAGMEVRESLARKAQAMGLTKLADDFVRGDLGAVQAFQKNSVQGAMEQLRQSMESGSRVAVQEFMIFQKNNPNITTDPRGIEKVYALSRKMHKANVEELKNFDEYRQAYPADIVRWPVYRQQQLEEKAKQRTASQAPVANEENQVNGQIPSAAIEHLKRNPSLRGQFDEWYGEGAAARVLGS